ncbi:MAG: ATP-dependent helicase HrpB [Alphaproteobacteria bacterium]|nr:ATP-dependent helicase HrpB [Alphaproteobacteria bacterium]
MSELPIESVLPDLSRVLRGHPNAVLQAPPGAGKTTRVPLALLEEPWLGSGRIVMLEPRRLAARAAAHRMAAMLGEKVGETVGYRVRFDSVVGPRTRIEVVTEGILTRRLQRDPSLEGVGAVLFDEFHERSLHADLGLALCLETQGALREDLRILVMSATLEGEPVARILGNAPIVTSEGRAWPVETRYLDRPPAGRLEDSVAAAVRRALEEEPGDVLVFLPGAGEIRRVERLLSGIPALIAPLYGDLPQEAQERAILPPPPGTRKVVLATSIAETSLTIEGVRVVVDCGLMRVARFDPRGGMTRLETVKASRASADQRRGRAGRLGPGVCYRLWSESAHGSLPLFTAPEILEADLAPLALELARWGALDPLSLAWIDPPPQAPHAQARDLLTRLGALDRDGRITGHGREMAEIPLHPRLAHMVIRGRGLGLGSLACDAAALLAERDIVRGTRDPDLRMRLDLMRGADGPPPTGLVLDHDARRHARRMADRFRQLLGKTGRESNDPRRLGLLVALAYPDRIARRRTGGAGQFRLANGRGAVLPTTEPLAAEDWLAVADLDGDKREARVYLAAPLSEADLELGFAEHFSAESFVRWDSREQAVQARRRTSFGALVLKDEPLRDPAPEAVTAALIEGIREMGLEALPWTPDILAWRTRVAFLRRLDGDGWPDVGDAALLGGLEHWLAPYLDGMSRRAHLKTLDLGSALRNLLDQQRQRILEEDAPTHLTVPSGSHLPIRYEDDGPVLAVRLQEMFGARETPAIGGGKVPLTLHLLSPAGRPVQVTRDLGGFWGGAYRQVKADLKGRYPKHHWPDDPLRAEPTSRTKRTSG